MGKAFIHAGKATLVAILVSLAICWIALTAAGASMDILVVAMCVVCPLALAFPASAYNHFQKQKITAAHDALSEAHRELAAVHRKLAERAKRDDMTGLYNRSAFIAAVEETRENSPRGALLLIDADNFKRINDSFGHLTGDEALRIIARAIRRGVRRTDPKGRLGGEEFGVFLLGARLGQAHQIAERVRRSVEKARFCPDGEHQLPLTVSIGVAEAECGANFSEVMAEADRRLYEAKRRGRNMVVVETRTSAAA